jgi:integrase
VSLYKRNTVWWYSIFIEGERVCESTGTSNRRKAEQIERQRREELNDRRHRLPQTNPDITFGTLAARFIAERMSTPYSVDRLQHLLPFFADVSVRDINQSLTRKYRQERYEERQSLKPATVNRDLSVLRRVLNWGVEEGITTANPLGKLRLERERRTKRPVMSVREEKVLMEHAPVHLRRIILCAVDTGLRRGEIVTQRWEDVDFDNRILHVSHSKTPEGESRIVPLTGRLYNLLLSFRKDRGIIFTYAPATGTPANPTDNIQAEVVKTDSTPHPIKIVKTAWASSLRRAGLRHFRFHDLRHTANTRLMLAGVLQEVRRELIGHSSQHSRDTNDRYSQIGLAELKDAIAKLELWLAAQANQLAEEEAKRLPQSITETANKEIHDDGSETQPETA